MILPTKHLSEERSILRIGAEILLILRQGSTVSRLWEDYQKYRLEQLRTKPVTYDWFVLALDLLFMLGAIAFSDGRLMKAKNDSPNLQFSSILQRA